MALMKTNFCIGMMLIKSLSPSTSTSTAFHHPSYDMYVPRHCINLYMASPQPRNRNRGANAANHNRRGHDFRLTNGGPRTRKKNSKRAPRWEREGDQLYAEISKRINKEEEEDGLSAYFDVLTKNPIESVDDVHRFLKPWTLDEKNEQSVIAQEKKSKESDIVTEQSNKPPFLWGSLPVGPVLASRLHGSDRSSPTPVQKAAFSILTAGKTINGRTKRTNAIIASPTGTGKTLAFILPILCTSPGGQFGEGTGGVLIVTPTIELACQIQREVNVLWPPDDKRCGCSALFVVGDSSDNKEENPTVESEQISPGSLILRSVTNSPIIAGTPKMLRMLYREAERVDRLAKVDPTFLDEEKAVAKALLTNMRAIVLDEADRLLRTEAVAREAAERKERKVAKRLAQESEDDVQTKKKRLIIARETQTELLLRDLPIPSLEDVQIICASATVGRTMRRQLMQILDAPSADAAATLITGEDDARVKSKDSERRKSVLLPEKLQHSYQVVNIESIVELAEELPELSVAQQNEERMIRAALKSLKDTTNLLEAKPLLIFPGKIGVERIQQELISWGFEDIRTLRNLDGSSPEYEINTSGASNVSNWKSVPVYVIGERFARGLDLPNVEYVAILFPPSSAAGYAHMAGRTGRSGKSGRAITFVRPKNNEVKRLVAIAETVGLKFSK